VVEDVVFSNNVVRHAAAGINILGRDDIHPSEQTSRIAIRGNLFLDIGGRWGFGRLFQLLDGARDVAITHNTAFQTGAAVFGGDHDPHVGFVFENNVVLHNEFGIGGSGTGIGRPSLARYFPGSVVRGNMLVGGNAGIYPDNNFFPATAEAAGFAKGPNGAGEAVRVRSAAGAGREATEAGANIEALSATIARVSSGQRDADASAEQTSEVNQAGILGPSRVAGDSEELLFWASLLLLAYTYAGYPLVALVRSGWWPKRHRRAPAEPTVSIIVAAHNEGACIEDRIENLLALDYPAGRRQIIVGSDGSTDDTASRASRFVEAGVRVHAFRRWRGKAAVLNRLVMSASGEIVLFAAARQRFDPGVIRQLVSHFADPTVGAVSGELMLSVDGAGISMGRGTSFYWRYEKFIRFHESRAASTVGATGAIYAIRRSLFEPIPTDTILDDVLIPLRIVRKGFFVQFEPKARAFQAVSASAHQECVRKRRTIAGMYQLFSRERWLLSPRQNPLWFETISHKGLRLVLPCLHAMLFATSMALMDGFIYLAALVGQVGFYSAAVTGHVFRNVKRPAVVTVPYAMCLMLWATVEGFARFITDRQRVTWEQSAHTVIKTSSSPAR
jgi:GT2 family glycosyltransferase